MDTHIGVLPHDVLNAISLQLNEPVTSGLRILKLPHPRTGVPSLFLPYTPASGVPSMLEVQATVPPNARSWFVGDQEVVSDGKLLLMTPVDPAFLLIPILQSVQSDDGTLGNFRQLDDIVEEAVVKLMEMSRQSVDNKDPSTVLSENDLTYFTSLACFQAAVSRICDSKEVMPGIVVYRFSLPRLVEYLRVKITRIATPDAFGCCKTLIRGLAKQGLMEDGMEDLLQLGRIRASCDLVAQYLPSNIRDALLASYDLTPLNDHLKKMEEEAAAALVETNVGKKTTKKTEGKDGQVQKRKAQGRVSQRADKLKKVDVNGMAKISSFFKKT